MSLLSKLETKRSQIGHVDQAINDIVVGISVSDLLKDPALELANSNSSDMDKKSPQNMSLYQLNSRIKEIEDSTNQLNEFWVIKNLFQEVELAIESGLGDNICIDNDELRSINSNLERLQEKITKLSSKNITIAGAMATKQEHSLVEYSAALVRLYESFIPTTSSAVHTIYGTLYMGDKSLTFEDFVDAAKFFEALHASGLVSEKLMSLKSTWESLILEPLISQRNLLKLTVHENGCRDLEVVGIDDTTAFSMDLFLESLQGFIQFVNATNLKSFKNYYSTKISNALADIISENIQLFTTDEENLTQKLMRTLESFSSSGWTIPLRNIFMAQKDIRETLKSLHLNWITDKYINQLRTLFTGIEFDKDLHDQKTVTHTIDVPLPVVHEATTQPTAPLELQVPQQPANPVVEDESEELEWDDNWGSDDDEFEKATKKSVSSDTWDDNWNEGWSEDDDDHVPIVQSKIPPKIQPKVISKVQQKVISKAQPTIKPDTQTLNQGVDFNKSTPKTLTETHTFVVSAIPTKLSKLLSDFEQETDGSDPRDLMDTIFSLALTSYPLLAHSFLMLNDLRNVECGGSYLKECAEQEWSHFCQSFSGDITKILSRPGSLDSKGENEAFGGESDFESISQIRGVMRGLMNSELRDTNSHELKSFVLQVLNLINNIVLQKILRCEEITEYQSEEFTRYLENLQAIESEVLAQFGEDMTVLATANKVMQTKFLINNHLKSIMEYFYQGELYDFSTDELVSVIKSVFIPSELRENCLNEIIDVRSS